MRGQAVAEGSQRVLTGWRAYRRLLGYAVAEWRGWVLLVTSAGQLATIGLLPWHPKLVGLAVWLSWPTIGWLFVGTAMRLEHAVRGLWFKVVLRR